ncbi:hypothetical protein GTZ78_34785 [Streptomyces sp. SID8361]|uniref:hypothetical protein n=1 Tax=Streptomyces sp. MnatMP-M27 TaxID=1839768 RepID=UPI00081EA741|nr:hypothetical protein [Streptomyces sp. MnatMP-M27]MYU15707.1 hypothetical protein [Streptomyces sp. SID8361]SCG10118.1 hypothetical protein GA0115260_110645 [Streptomyces sp. MnatMP-M27]
MSEAGTVVADPWSSKIRQHEAVAAADPDLAFDLHVLTGPAELTAHLAARRDRTVVLRPEVSDDTGSAVLVRPGAAPPEPEIRRLWDRGGRIVAHDHVPGTPCFVNGVVLDGVLHLTDVWRCFSLEEGPRSLLTSVVNLAPGSPRERELAHRLSPVVKGVGLASGPVTFEAVTDAGGTVKVVKFAARAAGHPLPHLCSLLGLPDQAAALAGGSRALAGRPTEPGFVADYAFVAREGGRLVRIEGLDEIRALRSYAGDIFLPTPGETITPTTGEGGAGAILLRNQDEEILLADVEFCQQRNREGVFAVAADARRPLGR